VALSAETALVSDLAVVMITAGVTTVLFHRLKMPTILGYLLAGLLVGPNLFGATLIQDAASIRTLATLGVVFLLFSVGLDFSLRRLASIGPFPLVAGSLQILAILVAGYLVGLALGWSAAESILLGAVLSISSTTIVVKILADSGQLHSDRAAVIFGILLVEDVAAIIFLALLSGYGATGAVSLDVFMTTLAVAIFFIAAVLAIGLVVIPRVVDYVATLASNEVLVVSVLGFLLGVSILAETLGLSAALGAFLAGAVVSEARSAPRVSDRILSVKDMFTAVFFTTMGMLVDPSFLLGAAPLVFVVILLALLGKLVAGSLSAVAAGYPPRLAFHTGLGLAVIGEFSFVIADLGDRLGLARPELFPTVVAASAATVLLAPVLMRAEPIIETWVARRLPPRFVSYLHLYSAWIRRIGTIRGRSPVIGSARGHLVQALLHAAALLAIVFAARFLGSLARIRAEDLGLRPSFAEVAVWILLGLAAVPFALAFARRVDRLLHDLAISTLPPTAEPATPSRAVINTMRLIAFFVFAAMTVLILGPVLPPLPLLIVLVVVLGLVLFLLRETIVQMNERIEKTLEQALQGVPPEEVQEIRGLIETTYPWGVSAGSATVPAGGEASGRTIRDLNLRRRTGATIVALDRGADRIVNPPPNVVLQPGDRVTVVGEEDQVNSARDVLRQAPTGATAPSGEARWVEVALPTTTPLAGRMLASMRLRERTGATIVGLSRSGARLPNPPPETRLEVGDVLLLMGSPEQVAHARAVLLASELDEDELPS